MRLSPLALEDIRNFVYLKALLEIERDIIYPGKGSLVLFQIRERR
jgi:hypothetical protein